MQEKEPLANPLSQIALGSCRQSESSALLKSKVDSWEEKDESSLI